MYLRCSFGGRLGSVAKLRHWPVPLCSSPKYPPPTPRHIAPDRPRMPTISKPRRLSRGCGGKSEEALETSPPPTMQGPTAAAAAVQTPTAVAAPGGGKDKRNRRGPLRTFPPHSRPPSTPVIARRSPGTPVPRPRTAAAVTPLSTVPSPEQKRARAPATPRFPPLAAVAVEIAVEAVVLPLAAVEIADVVAVDEQVAAKSKLKQEQEQRRVGLRRRRTQPGDEHLFI